MVLREILHAHIPVLHADSTVREAVDKMDIYQFPALVFVDDENRLLAVLTEGDICRAVSKSDSLVQMGHELALSFATKAPFSASVDMEIGAALHEMLMRGITVLPVIEEERVSGVALRMDLMQAILMDVSHHDLGSAS